MKKERLPVICSFHVSNELWTNCAELVITTPLLSKVRIVAEGSGQSITRLKIYTLHLWKKESVYKGPITWRHIRKADFSDFIKSIERTQCLLLKFSMLLLKNYICKDESTGLDHIMNWFIWGEKNWVLNPAKPLFIGVVFTHMISPTSYCHFHSAWSMPSL